MKENIRSAMLSRGSRSKIGWGAVFSGLFVAFVITLILEALGVAIGLTGDNTLGTGTAIWSVIVALVALFIGGWVMARTETTVLPKLDLAIHGTVLWGVLFFSLLVLGINGVQLGLNAILGAAMSLTNERNLFGLQDLFNQLNLSPEQMESLQEWMRNMQPNPASNAWWSFLGLTVSLAAVIIGAFVGGPRARTEIGTQKRSYQEAS